MNLSKTFQLKMPDEAVEHVSSCTSISLTISLSRLIPYFFSESGPMGLFYLHDTGGLALHPFSWVQTQVPVPFFPHGLDSSQSELLLQRPNDSRLSSICWPRASLRTILSSPNQELALSCTASQHWICCCPPKFRRPFLLTSLLCTGDSFQLN